MSSPVQCLIQISNSTVQTTLIICRNNSTNYHTLENQYLYPNTNCVNTFARYMTKYVTKGELS